jgi:ATP-binding protein involved in chromosome partitioning
MSGPALRPTRIVPFPNGEIAIAWENGEESYLAARELRLACSCARCVDETTGVKRLRDDEVPADVRPVALHPVGNYGIAIAWSDGHDTGIYTFETLRAIV